MGADFIIAVAPLCELTAERKEKLTALIAGLPDETLLTYENKHSVFNTDAVSKIRETLLSYCEMVCSNSDSLSRDCAVIAFEEMGWTAVLTGGMSWGDDPTESYHSIHTVSIIDEVYDQLKSWSIEDVGK